MHRAAPPSLAPPAFAPTATLQCFKPGRHVPLNGVALEFAQSDLAASAQAYDPALHEAPLVVGHPQLDAPAYGWVSALAFAGGALEATPAQVNPEFAAMVNNGAFKKMSAAFWAPDAPANPVPGVYYLRHIGFLGAAAPAVKGLRTPSFAGTEEGVVEFSEWDDADNASLWRSLRDWVLGKFGQDAADAALPSYLVAGLERGAQADLAAAQTASAAAATPAPALTFAKPQPQTENTTVTEAEKLALQAENTSLRQQIATDAAAARKARLDAAGADGLAFAETLVAQDRLATGQRDLVVAAFSAFAAQAETAGAALEFGEGEARAPLLPAFKALLAELPVRVATGRLATHGRAADGAGGPELAFAAPDGLPVDAARLALHQRALGYQALHPGINFLTAARAVGA